MGVILGPNLSKQDKRPNSRRPLRPINILSGTPEPFRVLLVEIYFDRGPRRDLFSRLYYFVFIFRLAEKVLEGPVSNRGVLIIQQPFNCLVFLRNFDRGRRQPTLRCVAGRRAC